jgi:hypothetical protein
MNFYMLSACLKTAYDPMECRHQQTGRSPVRILVKKLWRFTVPYETLNSFPLN